MITNILDVKLENIQLHKVGNKVYKKKNLDGLKLTMKFIGQLETVKAVERNNIILIIDGAARYYAAKELGWKTIRVEILDYTDEQIQDQLVLRNFRTKRSIIELCDHSELILGILGNSQGKKRETIGDLSLSDDEYALAGKDRFEIACEIIGSDISASSLRRILAVKDFVENGDDEIKGLGLMEKVENGEMKINQAYTKMKDYQSAKVEQGTNALTEAMEYVKGNNYKLFNKSSQDLSDLEDESVDSAVTSGPYFKQRDYPDGVRNLEHCQLGMEATVDEFVKNQVEINQNVLRKLKKTGSYFMVISDSFKKGQNCLVIEKLILEMINSGWSLIQKIVWLKDDGKPQNDLVKRLMPTYEYILHFCKDPQSYYYREFRIWEDEGSFEVKRGSNDCGLGHKMKDHTWWLKKPLVRFRNFLSEQHVKQVIKANGFNWSELKEIDPSFRHMAPYPSVIPLLPILMTTKPGDTVLDIYNGTGTTSAVALALGRNAIGYDTDTKSHQFAAKRLQLVNKHIPSDKQILEFENEFMAAS